MQFLNPLALLGLIAASIPVIIHLLNLRKLKIMEFSSLMFLKEIQKNKLRRIKIKQLILLILRVAAIVFLVLAFSRPALQNITIAGLGSEFKSTVIIVIDNSLSMSLSDKYGQYLQQAKRKALDIITQTREGSEIYVIPLSEIDVKKKDYLAMNKIVAGNFIKKLELAYSVSDFNNVMITASGIVEKSGNLLKEIYIITDNQEINFPSLPVNLSNVFNNFTSVNFIDIGLKKQNNLSLDSASVSDVIFELQKPVNINATISNRTPGKSGDLVTELYFGNTKVAQKGADVPPSESRNITLTGKPSEAGYIPVKIVIEEDDFNFDNTYYLNFNIPEKIKILLITDSPQDADFVNIALTRSFFDNSESVNEIKQVSVSSANSYDFTKYDLLMFCGPDNIRDISKIKKYVEDGGRVLVYPAGNSTPQSFDKFTSAFGISSVSGVYGDTKNKNNYTAFGNIDFAHPVFKNIFRENKKGNIESPEIYYSFNYTPNVNSANIIELKNGKTFLLEQRFGSGKVMLFTSALNMVWNDLPVKGIFLPLLNRIVQYLSSKEEIQQKYYTGGTYEIYLTEKPSDKLTLVSPEGREKIIDVKSSGLRNYFIFEKPEIPGNYKLIDNSKTIKILSVNLLPKESNLKKANKEDVEKFSLKISAEAKHNYFTSSDEIKNKINQARTGTELWKLFVVLSLLCLIAEMIIAYPSRKDTVSQNQ